MSESGLDKEKLLAHFDEVQNRHKVRILFLLFCPLFILIVQYSMFNIQYSMFNVQCSQMFNIQCSMMNCFSGLLACVKYHHRSITIYRTKQELHREVGRQSSLLKAAPRV